MAFSIVIQQPTCPYHKARPLIGRKQRHDLIGKHLGIVHLNHFALTAPAMAVILPSDANNA